MEIYDYKKTYEYTEPKLQTTLVTYKNDLNQISFKGLTHSEYNIFSVMMATARENNGEPVSMSFDQLKTLSKWTHTGGDGELVKAIKKFNQKIVGKHLEFEDMNGDYHFVPIFKEIWISMRNRGVVFELNYKFVQFFNDIKKSFTSYKLDDVTGLQGYYAKEIYRLMNWKKGTFFYQQNDGWSVWREPIDSFREFLGVPKSYRMTDINRRILEPTKAQIIENNLFADMRIEKEKQEKGNKITHIVFYFKTHEQAEKERVKKEVERKAKERTEKELKEKEFRESMLKSLNLGVS